MLPGGGDLINIAICDDEKYMSDEIRMLAFNFFRKKNVYVDICQFQSGEDLLKYNKKIDILFLDIQMNGINGIETSRILRNSGFKGFLVFITILKEMVFESFEVQAYDYIVKPVKEKQFEKIMERMFVSMQNAEKANLLVQKGYESSIIPFDDIIFCEIIDRKIYLHLVSSEVIDFYGRIEGVEKKLDSRFFKCHRSFLINLKYLKSYKKGTAYMEGGKEIPVSRLRSKEFSNVVLQYMKERWI